MTVKPVTVLVVDDNQTNLDLLERRLIRKDFQVDTADGGKLAIEKALSGDYDLILLDIQMPEVSGLDVLVELRKKFDAVSLPIIMVSAKNESESMVEAISLGANDYITKPIDFPLAFARIQTHLNVRNYHQALKKSEERYSLAFTGANDGLWDWDIEAGSIYFSDRWKEMLGYGPDEIEGTPDDWFKLIHPDELDDLKKAIDAHLNGDNLALIHEYRALHKDNSFRWFMTRGVASHDDDEKPVRLSGSQTDITQHKAYDPITGIPNQVLFLDRLEWAMNKHNRRQGGRFAVILIKIERLADIRNTLGPVKSEQILAQMAGKLNESLRTEDSVSRFEEGKTATLSRFDEADFALQLEDCGDENQITRLGERILQDICEPYVIDGEEFTLSCSMGVTYISGETETSAETIISNAGTALTRATAKGTNHFEIFDQKMQQRAFERLKLERELRHAIENGDLCLYYQPIIDLQTEQINTCEALVRWQHGERGMISPADFIPLAEETGLIEKIGEWVIRDAARQIKAWESGELGHLRVSVNVSVLQLLNDDMAERVLDILDDAAVDPNHLKIEITESLFMQNMDRVTHILNTLHDRGVTIAIDDYGTGYSSLAYLKKLPFTHLKLDQSFIRDVSRDVASQAIVQSTLLMAQSLGIQVIAEGIEEEDQLSLLKVLKAEFGQGFLFSKPLNAADFTAYVKAHQLAHKEAGRQESREKSA